MFLNLDLNRHGSKKEEDCRNEEFMRDSECGKSIFQLLPYWRYNRIKKSEMKSNFTDWLNNRTTSYLNKV